MDNPPGDASPGLFSRGFAGCRQFLSRFSGRHKAGALFFALFFAAGFFIADMVRIHTIDDNVDFAAPADPTATAGGKTGSASVAIAAALIHQQVDVHPWIPNKPPFMPSHYLDNMSHYQQGIISALGNFGVELKNQMGRSRASSEADPDLDKALSALQYAPNIWHYDPDHLIQIMAPSDTRYRVAREALLSYNQRLIQGKAIFDPRGDNLSATLDYFAADLGSQSAIIEAHLREHDFWLTDTVCDDIFYSTKGRLYAYYLLLREMKTDYADVIKSRSLEKVWDNMLDNFRDAIALRPLVIVSAAPDSQFLPSHLASQGFFLMRARTNMREITGILNK